MVKLADELARLPTLSAVRLRAEWLRVYKVEAPDMTADLLRRGLAHRLQERVAGGLTPAATREIARLSRRHDGGAGGAAPPPAPARIKPGTRLVRDWGGASHHVLVVDDGFVYRDQRYRSLSTIANLITGTRWSGPRFFGTRVPRVTADA